MHATERIRQNVKMMNSFTWIIMIVRVPCHISRICIWRMTKRWRCKDEFKVITKLTIILNSKTI